MFSLFRGLRPKIVPFKSLFHANQPLRCIQSDIQTVYKARREPWINPTMLLIGFIPFFTFGLGTWQLQRLQWKVALIDELEEKLQLQPLSLPKRIKCGLSLFGFAPSSEQWIVFQSSQTSYFEGFC